MFNGSLYRIALATPIIALLSLCTEGCFSGNVATLTLVNRSSNEIKSCVVRLNAAEVNFGSLTVGEKTSRTLQVRTDGSYDLAVQFANGKRLHQQLGYVTSGFNFADTVEIHDDRAELTAHKVSN